MDPTGGGEPLDIPSQWVLPGPPRVGIVINIPEMRLFYFIPRSGLVRTFPIGIGDTDWPSPIGKFKIIEKRPNPTWYIPASLQEKYGVKVMPPGPDNPLGDHWLGLSASGYGIHGTNIPWSVGRLVTHGCIRLYPEDIQVLFSTVGHGTPVEIIYAPVKIGVLSGRIYAEAHQDIYRKLPDYYAYGYRLLRETGMSAQVDQQKYLRVLQSRDGMAADVTLTPY